MQAVEVVQAQFDGTIAIVAARTPAAGAKNVVNREANSRVRREIGHAAGLGHILFDLSATAVEGTWERCPASARARALGVGLTLRIEGVLDALQGAIDAESVARVMKRFHVGPYATTCHLRNHGFLDDERRLDVLRELVA